MKREEAEKIIKTHRLVERKAKKGDWIYIVTPEDDRVNKGEIWEFVDYGCRPGSLFIKHPEGTRLEDDAANINNSKYLVVVGYPGISFV